MPVGDGVGINLQWVQTLDEANEFMRWLGERRPWLAVDTETGGFDWWTDELRTVQFGDVETGWCLEWNRWGGVVCETLAKYDGPIAMHNMKFDILFLESNGAPVKRHLVYDTRAMAHLIFPERTGLKVRSAQVFGDWARFGERELKDAMMSGGWGYDTVPIELLWRYASFDTVLTARLAEESWPIISANFQEIYDLESRVTMALADMERRGCKVDTKYLDEMSFRWGEEIESLTMYLHDEWKIKNPTSRPQIAKALQAQGHAFVLFTDKGNPVVSEDVLQMIDHPIAKSAMRLFHLKKYNTTYIESLRTLKDRNDFIHCSINPLGARTGRMSVSRPPLQQLPRQREVRDAFIPSIPMEKDKDGQTIGGNVLLLADYDQIEMRIMAHFSQDAAMLEAVRYGDAMTAAGHEGWDLHSATARTLYGTDPSQPVPKDQRQMTKSGGFAKIYGSGVATFAATVGVDLATAQQFLNGYDERFPGVRRFSAQVEATLNQRADTSGIGYVMSPYGRRQFCHVRDAYKAVNYLIQGTAADVLKDRIAVLDRSDVAQYMRLPVHDELLFDVPAEVVPDVIAEVKHLMPETSKFTVPLTVDSEVVDRWGTKYA